MTPFINPLAPKAPPLPAKAKSVIFLFMYGGPSHVDTFDYKPKLYPLDGKTIAVKTFGRGGKKNEGRIVGPKWAFHQYGQCGKWVSDPVPAPGDVRRRHRLHPLDVCRVADPRLGHADDEFGPAAFGKPLPGHLGQLRPGERERKPAGLRGDARPDRRADQRREELVERLHAGRLSGDGAPFRRRADPRPGLAGGTDRTTRRLLLDRLREKNEAHLAARADNSELAARIASYELAFKMQQSAPEAVDFARESPETLSLYGIDQPRTADFGRKCLIARRMVERGVRFVQIYSGGAHNDDNWDAHADLVANHTKHAGNTDKPIAGLIKDLKRRGLLDQTLIVWGGEFGRQPTAEYAKGTGRDHNSFGFTMWMAGGGIKGGTSVGQTDELGSNAVEDRFHVKNLHATILHQLGLDPNGLTYFYGGLHQKLVGVEGAEPIRQII